MSAPDNTVYDGSAPGSEHGQLNEKSTELVHTRREVVEAAMYSAAARNGRNTGAGETQPREMGRLAWFVVVLSVMSSVFLFSLDNTVVAVIQTSVISTFGAADKLPWVSVAFALGTFAVSLAWGRLFDIFDAKKLYCTAVLLFEVGSAVCGAAPTMDALIVGRTLAGFGGAGLYIGTVNIITNMTSLKERPLYLNIIGAMWSIGTILGPLVGGGFADSRATWRWAFYINLCVAALAAPVYLFVLPSRKPSTTAHALSWREIAIRLDFAGIVLFAGASTSLVMAIAFGGSVYEWNSGRIIGLFVCAGVLWILFAIQQVLCLLTTSETRLFPIEFLQSVQMCILFAQIAACTATTYVALYFLPLYFQFVRGDSAIWSGIRLLPNIFVAVVGALLNGLIMGKYGYYMPWFLAGGIFVTIGGSLLHTIGTDTPFGTIYGFGIILGFGAGLYVQAPFTVAQAKVEQSDKSKIAAVTAFIATGQITGAVLALSIGNSIFVNSIANKLAAAFPAIPRAQLQSLLEGTTSSFLDSLPASIRQTVLELGVDSIREVFVMLIVSGAFTIVLSGFMSRERLAIPSLLPF